MATGTVADERTERKRELETARRELAEAMARYASAEVASASGGDPDSHPALVDQRNRRTAVSTGRSALEAAYRTDRAGGNAPWWGGVLPCRA